LLGGVLKPLDTKTWTYKSKGAGMSIVQLEDQPRMSIEWDMDDQRMLNRAELAALLQAEGPYAIMIRMRESNALELQQQLLADMGRVGLISKMPFTFPVDVNLYTVDKDGNLQHLDLPITASDGGVCITGREGDSERTRLILTEASVDEILSAIPKIKAEDIPERSRETLKRLQASTSFRTLLQRGLDAPAPTVKGVLPHLKVPSAALDEKGGPRDEIVGLIVRNPPDLAKLQGPDLKNSSIVLMIRDLEPEAAGASKVTRLDDAQATETEAKS
jgi:hypothetical protein